MMEILDLNHLAKWAATREIGLKIYYWPDLENTAEIETVSPAPVECYYMKRCSDVRYFIECWEKNLKEKQ